MTGNQCSEMRRVYRGVPETISRTISHSGNPQPPVLADHHTEGPTKVINYYTLLYLIKLTVAAIKSIVVFGKFTSILPLLDN